MLNKTLFPFVPHPSQGSFSLLLQQSVQMSLEKPKVGRSCTKTFEVFISFFFFQLLSCGSKKPRKISALKLVIHHSGFALQLPRVREEDFIFFFPLLIVRRIFHFVIELFSHSAMSSGGEELCSQTDEMKMLASLHCIKQAL